MRFRSREKRSARRLGKRKNGRYSTVRTVSERHATGHTASVSFQQDAVFCRSACYEVTDRLRLSESSFRISRCCAHHPAVTTWVPAFRVLSLARRKFISCLISHRSHRQPHTLRDGSSCCCWIAEFALHSSDHSPRESTAHLPLLPPSLRPFYCSNCRAICNHSFARQP